MKTSCCVCGAPADGNPAVFAIPIADGYVTIAEPLCKTDARVCWTANPAFAKRLFQLATFDAHALMAPETGTA